MKSDGASLGAAWSAEQSSALEHEANLRCGERGETRERLARDGDGPTGEDAQPARASVELLGQLGEVDRALPSRRREASNAAIAAEYGDVEAEHLGLGGIVEEQLAGREADLASQEVLDRDHQRAVV